MREGDDESLAERSGRDEKAGVCHDANTCFSVSGNTIESP